MHFVDDCYYCMLLFSILGTLRSLSWMGAKAILLPVFLRGPHLTWTAGLHWEQGKFCQCFTSLLDFCSCLAWVAFAVVEVFYFSTQLSWASWTDCHWVIFAELSLSLCQKMALGRKAPVHFIFLCRSWVLDLCSYALQEHALFCVTRFTGFLQETTPGWFSNDIWLLWAEPMASGGHAVGALRGLQAGQAKPRACLVLRCLTPRRRERAWAQPSSLTKWRPRRPRLLTFAPAQNGAAVTAATAVLPSCLARWFRDSRWLCIIYQCFVFSSVLILPKQRRTLFCG